MISVTLPYPMLQVFPSKSIGNACYAGYQGRSQEETTTEANTRSVVRNQPYEIF